MKNIETPPLVTVATIALYISGWAYYIQYYNVFGIDIMSYMSLSEILVGSIRMLFKLLIQFFLLYTLMEIFLGSISCIITKCKKEEYRVLFLSFLTLLALFFFNGMILICVVILSFYMFKLEDLDKYTSFISTTFFISFSLLLLLGGFSSEDAKNILVKKEKNKKVVIIMSNKTYDTECKDLFYIGETVSSVFVYDSIQKNAIIISRNSIQEIRIKKEVLFDKRMSEFKQLLDIVLY